MGDIVTIVLIMIALGFFPAFIAWKKGAQFIIWWIYGATLFPIALIHAFLIGRGPRGKKVCGFCRKQVDINAPFCKFCGYEFFDLS